MAPASKADARTRPRTTLVTGAGKGIGRAVALGLAEVGIDVAVNDLDERSATECADAVRELGRRSLVLPGDIASPQAVKLLAQQLAATWGGVDILVNNAGITHSGNLPDTTNEAWERLMNVNLRGPFLTCRALTPYMIERRWGRVINMASMTARLGRGYVGSASYGASKGGVATFTRGMSKELAAYGITVNAIAPGVITTDMNREYLAEHGESVLRSIPLERFGTPEDVADAVVFLASDRASYITGVILDVNGGLVFG